METTNLFYKLMSSTMSTSQNNDIMARLLAESWTSIPNADTDQTSIASARVLSTRYKVYFLVVIVLIYIFLQYIFFPALDKQQLHQGELQNIVSQLQSFEAKRLKYLQDASFIQKAQEQQDALLACINQTGSCDIIDPLLQERKDLAQYFLKLQNVADPVMWLDEKRILASLNDYALLRFPNNPSSRERNGTAQSIRIGDPVVYDGAVYRVPVDMEISFANKDGLLSFINNIENTVAVNPSYRLMYVIDQIDYDVVKYNEEQKAKVALSLFYYNPAVWVQ